MDLSTYIILGAATAAKVLLLGYCWALRKQSDSMMALAEDHSNDIVSNLGAGTRMRSFCGPGTHAGVLPSAGISRQGCGLQHALLMPAAAMHSPASRAWSRWPTLGDDREVGSSWQGSELFLRLLCEQVPSPAAPLRASRGRCGGSTLRAQSPSPATSSGPGPTSCAARHVTVLMGPLTCAAPHAGDVWRLHC